MRSNDLRTRRSVVVWSMLFVLVCSPGFVSAQTVATQVARADAPVPLPPLNANASISESKASAESDISARVEALEKATKQMHDDLAAGGATRLAALEASVHLQEERQRIAQTLLLTALRSQYVNSYSLYDAMETRARALSAQLASLNAYQSVVELSDLRLYSGFNDVMNVLLPRLRNPQERSWVANLVTAVVPQVTGVVKTLSAWQPVLRAAGFALAKLQNILPSLTRENFHDAAFVNAYDKLSCGLTAVNAIHDDLAAAAMLNAELRSHVDSLHSIRLLRAVDSLNAVIGPVTKDENSASFFLHATAYFDALNTAPPEKVAMATDRLTNQQKAFGLLARDYAATVDMYIQYWERMKAQLLVRRNTPCLASDPATLAKYDAAAANIDSLITTIRAAYLFESRDKPENEYFRLVTQH